MSGQAHYTLRSYRVQVETVLHWALLTGHLERDPTIVLPQIARDIDAEQVDPIECPMLRMALLRDPEGHSPSLDVL